MAISKFESILALLSVAQCNPQLEILFTLPMPTDIVSKYEFMRSKTFQKAGLVHNSTSIWKLQRQAHARQREKTLTDFKPILTRALQFIQSVTSKIHQWLQHPFQRSSLVKNFKSQQVQANKQYEIMMCSLQNKQSELLMALQHLKDNFKSKIYRKSESEELEFYRFELESTKNTLQKLQEKYRDDVNFLTAKLEQETEELRITHHKEIQNLQFSENQMRVQIEKLNSEDLSVKEIKDSLDLHMQAEASLQMLMVAIQDRVGPIYRKFQRQERDQWQEELWTRKNKIFLQFGNQEFTQILVQIDFLGCHIDKLTADNNWLVDRLAEFGKQNEILKISRSKSPDPFYQKVWTDIQSTSDALKEFQEARNQLISQFENTCVE